MNTIRTFNKIDESGIEILKEHGFVIDDSADNADGIIVRSASLHDISFSSELKAIARAGAGVNNIPVERCNEKGIVVFNTPGSNANSVKELVLAGLLLSSRDILGGYNWTQTIPQDEEVAVTVEKEKIRFAGPEIQGKTLGVIGLGAIGVMVANAADALGMNVIGYDPFLSVDHAWRLSRTIRRAQSLEALVGTSDYLTLHAPLNDDTRHTVDEELLTRAKRGLRILNFARGGLVDSTAMLTAIENGTVSWYVTDFPEASLLGKREVITIPHLGASTPEAEANSAVMAARQIADYLEFGIIRNSVNFPECTMAMNTRYRLTIANRNIPNMVGQISTALAEASINISDMVNRHRGNLAYNIIDVDSPVPDETVRALHDIDGVIVVRTLEAPE